LVSLGYYVVFGFCENALAKVDFRYTKWLEDSDAFAAGNAFLWTSSLKTAFGGDVFWLL